MQYRFLDQSDEKLIESSELPLADGIAVALRSTGYSAEDDEVLELAIVDLDGNELFSQVVKPQNKEEWEASDAAGAITPSDVEEAPDLFQFEDEISDLFEHASVVVAAHLPFAESMIEASWVTLPKFVGFDLVGEFLASHCTSDYPNRPATVATVDGIAAYYGVQGEGPSLVESARLVACCYRAFVQEHADERAAKGADYWERYNQRKEEEAAIARAGDVAARNRERYLNRMNGALWLVGGIIFTSVAIQLYQRGGDMGFIVVAAIAAAFCCARALLNFQKR